MSFWENFFSREVTLTCMRLADMARVHPDQIERNCSQCGSIVGIYPSGQKVLAEHRRVKILCQVCGPNVGQLAPGALGEGRFSRPKS